MSYADQKVSELQEAAATGGTKPRAKLHAHLAHRGWWAQETDAAGPVSVWVKGGDCVQLWRRDSKEKGDIWMTLEETRKVSYE